VVVVFRRESIHDWSPIDRVRLRLLLTNSILPLALCMFGLLLLTIKPVPTTIWKWCSGCAFVIFVFFATTTARIFRRLDVRQLQSEPVTGFVVYLFGVLGTAATVLQLYNVIFLGVFWPFFAGIAFQLTAAMFQFLRIILIPPQ
jgi:hypothetical protein